MAYNIHRRVLSTSLAATTSRFLAKSPMENLTIRSIDHRVLVRLAIMAANNGRPTSEEARDILSRAVGIEPKSGFPPPPKGAGRPCVLNGSGERKPRRLALTVYHVNQRLMRKIKAAAGRNKRTTSAEARGMIMEAVGYDPPLPEGVVSGYEALNRIFAPIRDLGAKMPTRDEVWHGTH